MVDPVPKWRAPAVLATLVLVAAPSGIRAEEPRVPRFPPAAPVVEGSPRDCGKAYGKLFRDGIKDFLDKEIFAPFVGKPSSRAQLLDYAAACGKVLRDECPLVSDELDGIADGAGLTFNEVVLIHLHEELYHRVELPKTGHCTAVAVGPPDTGDRSTYVGQTWDWMQTVAGKSAVVEWRRTGGVSVLAYGFPGMPMGAGVNAAGIALCWTSAGLGTKGQSPRIGIPSYALITHLLAQQDLASVIREAQKDKHAGWFTFVVADGEGNLVNIEGSPTGGVVEPVKGRLARVDYGSVKMTRADPEKPIPLNARCRKMYDLLEATKGRNDLDQMQRYFAEPKHGINVGKGTIDQMVFDTTARTAYVSRGTSYGLGWQKYAFTKEGGAK